MGCNGRQKLNWCKSEGVICSEGVKLCKSWGANGGKNGVRVKGYLFRGVKRGKN